MEKLNGVVREKRSNNDAKRERKGGRIPGIIYGMNVKNLMFEISELEFNNYINKNGEHGIVQIDINGTNHETLVKEVQKDPVSHKIIHIDFEEYSNNEFVVSDVPIVLTGENLVKKNGGILQKEKNSIKVKCMAKNLPQYINIDISSMNKGDIFKIEDLEFSQEIITVEDLNTVIVSVTDKNISNINSVIENDIEDNVE